VGGFAAHLPGQRQQAQHAFMGTFVVAGGLRRCFYIDRPPRAAAFLRPHAGGAQYHNSLRVVLDIGKD